MWCSDVFCFNSWSMGVTMPIHLYPVWSTFQYLSSACKLGQHGQDVLILIMSQASPSASLELRKKPLTPQSDSITPNKPNRSQWPGRSRFEYLRIYPLWNKTGIEQAVSRVSHRRICLDTQWKRSHHMFNKRRRHEEETQILKAHVFTDHFTVV